MGFWHILIGIAALIILLPYIRLLFKRLTCMRKLKKLCRKKGHHLHATHPLWFLGDKRSQNCDLYIETASEVYAVKLFGLPRKRSALIIKENGDYMIRNHIAMLSHGGGYIAPFDSKSKPMPAYDFRYHYQDEWEIKTPRQILLVNPTAMEIRRLQQHGREVIAETGDIIGGMELFTLSHLLKALESTL